MFELQFRRDEHGLWVDQFNFVYPLEDYDGPVLRTRLGLQTVSVWEYLQYEAAETMRRGRLQGVDYGPVVDVKRGQAAKACRLSEHGVARALARLEQVGIITRQRAQYSTRVRVEYFDLEIHYPRDTSRRRTVTWTADESVPPCVLMWLKTVRSRGRPRRMCSPVATNQPMTPPGTQEAQMVRRRGAPDHRTCPIPTKPAPFPLTPRPPRIPDAFDVKETRQFLERAYVSAAQVFWVGAPVGQRVRWMRSPTGKRVLDAAAVMFRRKNIPPQAWLYWFFRDARKKRKMPTPPEFVYEPTLIEARVEAYLQGTYEVPWEGPVQPVTAALAEILKGKAEFDRLAAFNTQARTFAKTFPSMDVAKYECEKAWPQWREWYLRAESKACRVWAQLHDQALSGTFLWAHLVPREG